MELGGKLHALGTLTLEWKASTFNDNNIIAQYT